MGLAILISAAVFGVMAILAKRNADKENSFDQPERGKSMKITTRQIEMLRSFERDGEATDYCAFYDTGAGALAWRNRERVIDALHRRGLLNDDGLTNAGRQVLLEAQEVKLLGRKLKKQMEG
jgi:hypothetical protein